MGTVETVFATVVGVLAAAAVIGALVYAITWEVAAIRRVLAAHRDRAGNRPLTDEDFWRQQRALNEPQEP
jgi:hypothetical protein